MKPCGICGTEFEPSKYNSKYCSDLCRHEAHKAVSRATAAKRYTPSVKDFGYAPCVHCGVEFKRYRPNNIYCGRLCQWNAKAARQRPDPVCSRCGVPVQQTTGVKVCVDCKKSNRGPRKDYERARRLRTFGITEAEYDQMFKSQDGRCAICRTDTPSAKGWCIDHCHSTGVVRGILCSNCNTGLGHFRDSEPIMLAAIEYLNTPRQLRLAS